MSDSEWVHLIDSEDVGVKALHVELSPPQDTIPTLCKRLNLHHINDLKASFKLQRNNVSKVIHVHGRIYADILQKCVITTDPVQEIIDDEFDAWFADPNSAVSFMQVKRERMSSKEQSEQQIMGESEDPEEVVDGKIDLGELVTQNLSLSLNPYPRCSDARYENQSKPLEDAPEGTYDNPFAALKDWKSKEGKKDR